MLSPQEPRDVCVYAGFCSAMKKSTPMLKLQPAMNLPAFKFGPAANSVPAAKLFPATKVESAKDKSSPVCHDRYPTTDPLQYFYHRISI